MKGLGKPVIGERGAKVGIYGAWGTGKTELVMSATKVGHLLLLDSEGRSQYYDADENYGFEVVYSKDVNDAIALLTEAERRHKNGERVVYAIDSFSGIWFEQQEVAERAGTTSRGTPKYSSWGIAKKPLKKLYSRIFTTQVDCLITMRSKPKYDNSTSAPKDLGHDAPDTERGINYVMDMVIELHKDNLKPGTPLTGENFHATVIKTSGPKNNNPFPVGTRITDPVFSKMLSLRLRGNDNFKIAGVDPVLQAALSSIDSWPSLRDWVIGQGVATNEQEVGEFLTRRVGPGFQAVLIPRYISAVLEELKKFPAENLFEEANANTL